MAFATIPGQTFYVQGGQTGGNGTMVNQFYSLDLTQSSWNATSPPWKLVTLQSTTTPAPLDAGHSATLTRDQMNIIFWGHNAGVAIYNISEASWSTQLQGFPNNGGLHAVTSPDSGLVYIPFASSGSIIECNPDMNLLTSNPLTGEKDVFAYNAIWSTQRDSVVAYGGRSSSGQLSSQLFEYIPGTTFWSPINTTGSSPGGLSDHCMVPASNGAKIVVFGGQSSSTKSSGSIYILDLKSLSWTKGTDVGSSEGRSGMACTITGNNFIAWGGYQNDTSFNVLNTTIIYNLSIGQWVTQFVQTSTTSTSTSKAGIIGGIAAAVIVLLIAVFYFCWRRRYTLARDCEDIDVERPSYDGQSTVIGSFLTNTNNTLIKKKVRSPEAIKSHFDPVQSIGIQQTQATSAQGSLHGSITRIENYITKAKDALKRKWDRSSDATRFHLESTRSIDNNDNYKETLETPQSTNTQEPSIAGPSSPIQHKKVLGLEQGSRNDGLDIPLLTQNPLKSNTEPQNARSVVFADLSEFHKEEMPAQSAPRSSRFRRSPQDHSQLQLMQELHQSRMSQLFLSQALSESLQLYPASLHSGPNHVPPVPSLPPRINQLSLKRTKSGRRLQRNQTVNYNSQQPGETVERYIPLSQPITLSSGLAPISVEDSNGSPHLSPRNLQQYHDTLSISSEDQLMLEQQIADFQAEHDIQYLRQQQILERLRLEKQAEQETLMKLEILQRRLKMKKENSRHNHVHTMPM
ncbi:hypothetical protein BGZ49_004743 [Haplosporangium sp. Z 27]|nr:hypothetical protein BGZ49_004743 [Haplosporangium sp. Z 27]